MSIKSSFKVTSGLDVIGNLIVNGSSGDAGQVLVSNGPGNLPSWSENSSSNVNNLLTWGINTYGQLGNSNTNSTGYPFNIGFTNWSKISAGYYHTAAIKTDGTLWTWGYNDQGQLGDNTAISKSSPVQTIAGGTNWNSVSCGTYYEAAIKTDGTLWLWGQNIYGQLGDNSTISKSSPVQTIAGGTNWSKIDCGSDHTAAIKTDGTLWVWGRNNYGNLGDNTLIQRSSPVQTICGGNNWIEISCGGYHIAAIKTDGTLWAWGPNNYGVVGDNTLIHRSSPVQTIAGGTNWSKVSCGNYHTAAIKTDGTLWIWGYNTNGLLGNGSNSSTSSPIQTICGGTNWSSVSCGYYHTAAIKTDGTLWTWGNNDKGQLGDNTLINKSSPIQTIISDTNWNSVSCGYKHTIATTF